MKFNFLFILLTLLFSSQLWAVDLTDRVGIGYSDAFITQSSPSIQVKYTPLRDISFAAALGIDTNDDDSNFGILLKAHKIIFFEANMNFYLGGHTAFVSQETTVNNVSDTETGVEFGVLCGAEFFIPGLENLGITFEAGLGITTAGEGITFKTIANHPLKAGMIFYF